MPDKNYLYSPEKFREQLEETDESTHDRVYITGRPLGPIEYHFRQGDDGMHLCMDVTIGFDVEMFSGSGIEAMTEAQFPWWLVSAVPRDRLSADAKALTSNSDDEE